MNRWQHERMVEDQEREERFRSARGETASHVTPTPEERERRLRDGALRMAGPGIFGPALGGADRQSAAAQASDLERLTRNAQASIVILERRLHAAHGVLVRMRDSIRDCEKNKAHGHAAALKDHADDLARALEAT